MIIKSVLAASILTALLPTDGKAGTSSNMIDNVISIYGMSEYCGMPLTAQFESVASAMLTIAQGDLGLSNANVAILTAVQNEIKIQDIYGPVMYCNEHYRDVETSYEMQVFVVE